MIVMGAIAALMQPIPKGAFVPITPTDEIVAAYETCRSVVTPRGLDRTAMSNRGWSGVRVQDSNGMYLSKEPNVWGPPNSYILVSLVKRGRTISCSVAARVQDQNAAERLISSWPQPLNSSRKKGQFATSVDGARVVVSYSGKKFPNVNVRVSRDMEQK